MQLPEPQMRKIRGSRIAMIFQEPMTSLNPVFTIGDQIAEAVELHESVSRQQAWQRAVAMLARVGIPDPARRAEEYPQPDVRRHAATGHDRHGAVLQPRYVDRR